MSRARASGQKVEDRTKWDGTSRTFAKPDGTWSTQIWSSAVNFRADDGTWQPIDSSLRPSDRAGFTAESTAGPVKLLLPSDAGRSAVRLEDRDGRWVSFRLLGASGAPKIEKDSATFADGPAASKVRYDSMPWGVKESIILPAAPDSAPVYTFDLRGSDGLVPSVTDEHEVVLKDAAGNVRFRMPAPFMEDASPAIATSSAIAVDLKRAGAGWQLSLSPHHNWLADPSRVYPVVIDPTVTPPLAASKDTFLAQDAPTTTNGGSGVVRVGSSAGTAGTNRRGLLQFSLPSSIPTQATVNTASLDLYLASTREQAGSVEYIVRRMNPVNAEFGATWTENATWNTSYINGESWSGATNYFVPATDPKLLVGTTPNTLRSWDVKTIVTKWVRTPADNNGFFMKATSEPAANEHRFGSRDGLVSQRPALNIEWSTAPPTIQSGSLKVDPSISTTAPVTARSLTPTISATASDPDSLNIGYKFEVVDDATGSVVASTPAGSSKTNPSPGTSVSFSYAVPVNALAEGKTYTAKFSVSDETTTAGPSQSLKFKVDQAPTAPTDLKVDPATTTSSPWVTPVIDPQLSAVIADPGSTAPVKAVFEMRKQGSTTTYEVGADEVEPGSRAGYTVPPEGPDGLGALIPGTTYEFRVGAQDEVAQGQTTPPTVWAADWFAFTVAQNAHISVPLQLAEPLTVWHSGPDLSWTPYRDPSSAPGDNLAHYQIFRGCKTLPDGACTAPVDTYDPAAAGLTLLDTLDPGQTFFHDRKASASSPSQAATYRYWIVAQTVDEAKIQKNGALASNSREVTTPRVGRVRRILNEGVADGTISEAKPNVPNADVLQAGNAHPTDGKQRALLDFDVSVINPGLRITSATLQANKLNEGAGGAFALHEILQKDFVEGQATWQQASTTDNWATPGGDLAQTALAQATAPTEPGAVSFTDSTIRAAVQKWVNDRAANHGIAIRAVDEGPAGQRWLNLVPTQSTQQDSVTLTETRPRLVVEHMTTRALETISAPDVPQRYVPNTDVTVPVTVTNTTDEDWQAGLQVSYRWKRLSDDAVTTGARYPLFPDSNTTRGLKSGESVTVQVVIAPPINSDTGNDRDTKYQLELDLWKDSAWWTDLPPNGEGYRYYQEDELSAEERQDRDERLAANVCALLPTGLRCPGRLIKAPKSTDVGLEKFASYTTEATGAGSALLANLNNGNLLWSYDAMSNPSVGPSFFARVTYNSKEAGTNTGAGAGWSVQPGTLNRLNAPLRLLGSDYKSVALTDGDGTVHTWSNPTTVGAVTTYERPAGIHLDLVHDTSKPADERYRFARADGTRFYFDGTALLPTKVVDISGQTLNYRYVDPAGSLDDKLWSVVDSKGRTVANLGYNANHKLTSIRDISNRALKFEYYADNANLLRWIRDGRVNATTGEFLDATKVKEFEFEYATQQANLHSVLTKVIDPRDRATTIRYIDGMVRSWTDRSGQITDVEYYSSYNLPPGTPSMPAGAARFTRVVERGLDDPMTTYGIDAFGRTIEVKDANANTPGVPADRAADVSRLGWDADHNVVRQELPNEAVSRWQYDADTGFPRRIWDAEAVRNGGKPTVMAYHPRTPNGVVALASVTSPLGHTSRFEIDTAGRLMKVIDPEHGETTYDYNADGTMKSAAIKSSADVTNVTTYAYPTNPLDNVGYPTTITPPQVTRAPGDNAPDAPTSFVYDVRGNVKTSTTGSLVTTAVYDHFGRPESVTTPGAQGGSRTTKYVYDLNDNTERVDAPNGGVTTTVYRADDEASQTTLPDNGAGARTVVFAYDALGRLCREVAPNAGLTSTSCPAAKDSVPIEYATDYWYDALGQVQSVTGRDGDGNRVVTSYEYDNVGNVVGMTDPKTNRANSTSLTTELQYDLVGRQVKVIDALGYATRTVYDADGNVVRTTDQAGKVKKFTYDKAGRNKTVTVTYNSPSGPPEEWTTTKCYDLAGNLVRVIRPRSAVKECGAPTGLFSQTMYDENNRPFQTLSAFDATDSDTVYQKPTSTFLRYDALGRMSAQAQPTNADTAPAPTAAKEWTRFTHFDSGEIATSVDPLGISTAYEYDLIGKQTKRTLTGAKADGTPSTSSRTMTWAYNLDGSLRERTDASTDSTALVVDNGDGETSRTGTWSTVKPTGSAGQHGVDYLAHVAGGGDSLTWKVTPADSGKYRVEFSCPSPSAGEPAGSRTASASYTLSAGVTTFTRSGDQTGCSGGWRALGEPVDLDASTPATLKVTPGAAGVTVADAVRLVAVDAKRHYTYVYDRNGQQEQVIDGRPGGRVSKFVTAYDVLGRVGSVKEYGAANPLVATRQTLYSYDANSNVTKVQASRLPENAPVDGRGSLGASSTTSYAWDARNLVDTVTQQIGSGTARTWDYQWNSRGLLETLTKPNAAGTAGSGNVVSYRYFDNGLLRDKIEKQPGAEGVVTSSHALIYNADGDPTRDIGKVQRHNATSTWRRQTVRYAYSPTQALRSVDKTGDKAGDDEAYKYDVAGNTEYAKIGKTTTRSKYDGNRLTEATATTCPTAAPCTADTGGVSSTSTYAYDDFGRLASVANPTVAAARATYTYDGFDRVVGETHGELSKTTAYDPFDRVTVQNVTKAGTSKKTRFNYLGTSEQVAAEERWDTGASAWKQVKAYGYGPDGKPLVMQSTPITGEVKTRFYSTSTHGDTEALTDPDTGNVTAAYRYTAYGAPDFNDNAGEDPVAQKDDASNPADPTKDALNPYRYSSKRIDSATGDYDMGFRNYSPGLNRFLTRDMYNGALSDLKLGMDPWNTNRYAFAGGNPITRIELDGHRAIGPDGEEVGAGSNDSYSGGIPYLTQTPQVADSVEAEPDEDGGLWDSFKSKVSDTWKGPGPIQYGWCGVPMRGCVSTKMTMKEEAVIGARAAGEATGALPALRCMMDPGFNGDCGWTAATVVTLGLARAGAAARSAYLASRAGATVQSADRVGAITSRLQSHVDRAVADYDSGAIAMTRRQRRAVSRNPNLAATFRGQVIDKAVKKAVRNDSTLNDDLWVSRSGEFGPDFHDLESGAWFDVTTPGQWQQHVDKYSDTFGYGVGLFTQ